MSEEDSGQLLESSDLDSSLSHVSHGGGAAAPPPPSPRSNYTKARGAQPQNHQLLHPVLKSHRSKSLPAPYLCQINLLQQQGQRQLNLIEDCGNEKSAEGKSYCCRRHCPGGDVVGSGAAGAAGFDEIDDYRQVQEGDSALPAHRDLNGGGGLAARDNNNEKSRKEIDGIGREAIRKSRKNNKQLSDLQRVREQESSDSKKRSELRTLQQHYYPEGGWGWVVTVCAVCAQALVFGAQVYMSNVIFQHSGQELLGGLSMGISLLFSPVWVSICKRKSTRLAAVFGGLVASLGCLFTSFATEYHQLFFSYGAFLGVGVGLTRDASSLMVGQYFKRKRETVEIIVVAGSGLGLVVMSLGINAAIRNLNWRLGLQMTTCVVFLTFFLGTCYRSASLYHPQRRAILHLKNQKRKVKDKEKREDRPPFIDTSCLRSKTLQILIASAAVTSGGLNNPLFYMVKETRENKITDFSMILMYVYVGSAWVIGCCFCGLLSVQKNQECRVSKQYLCQVTGLLCGICVLALTTVKGLHGLVIFSWAYGFSLGGYYYSLKVYTYERVRARHFPRAWSFVQCGQAIPVIVGAPLTGYLNWRLGYKVGYVFSALCIILGSMLLFLTDVRKRKLSRRKARNSSIKTCETLETTQSPKSRRLSFSFPIEPQSPSSKHDPLDDPDDIIEGIDPAHILKELTCISEEGLADIDFQDLYFEEWEELFGGECITSCNKVEDCLVSECDGGAGGATCDFPSNAPHDQRRARRWSRPNVGSTAAAVATGVAGMAVVPSQRLLQVPNIVTPASDPHGASTAPRSIGRREIPAFRKPGGFRKLSHPHRAISVIDEASM